MNISIQNILGDSNNAYMMMEIFRGASNVILTDNPEFTREDFSSIFPVFKLQDGTEIKQDEIPTEVYNLFYLIFYLRNTNHRIKFFHWWQFVLRSFFVVFLFQIITYNFISYFFNVFCFTL